MDVTTDWYWEGNVVDAIARFLVQDGWSIVRKADTHSKERGVDIQATILDSTILVEAKGYPSKNYRDPRRAAEVKPTNPTNQAQQWYSHALLKAMRLQSKHPTDVVAIGLPDFPRYRALFEETRTSLAKLGIAMLIVRADGVVETSGMRRLGSHLAGSTSAAAASTNRARVEPMTRIAQTEGQHGSQRWIQRATNERWPSLDQPILQGIGRGATIEWLSPLAADDFAEYRDGAFLDRIGLERLKPLLDGFWPARGPQWDALGKTDEGDLLLVEAKAHVKELCSPGTMAGEKSRSRIEKSLYDVATVLGVRPERAAWADFFYQLANRIAHLHFLRSHNVSAFLVLVNFLNDAEMGGPHSREAWEAAYEVAFHVMGLPARHRLSPYIIHAFPDVGG